MKRKGTPGDWGHIGVFTRPFKRFPATLNGERRTGYGTAPAEKLLLPDKRGSGKSNDLAGKP